MKEQNETGSEPVVVREWAVNSREILRVRLDQYKGNQVLDIRRWYEAGGELRPGKGLTIGIRHLSSIAEAINEAVAEARRRKLTGDGQ